MIIGKSLKSQSKLKCVQFTISFYLSLKFKLLWKSGKVYIAQIFTFENDCFTEAFPNSNLDFYSLYLYKLNSSQ